MQGQQGTNNWSFRAYKYPLDYPGFYGLDLTPGETIESGTDISDCMINTETLDISLSDQIDIHWMSADHLLKINILESAQLNIALIDVSGRIVSNTIANSYPFQMSIPSLMSGVYFVRIIHENGEVHTHKIFNAFSY